MPHATESTKLVLATFVLLRGLITSICIGRSARVGMAYRLFHLEVQIEPPTLAKASSTQERLLSFLVVYLGNENRIFGTAMC